MLPYPYFLVNLQTGSSATINEIYLRGTADLKIREIFYYPYYPALWIQIIHVLDVVSIALIASPLSI